MSDPSEDEKGFEEIALLLKSAEKDGYINGLYVQLDRLRQVINLANDGLKWIKAAAAESEVKAGRAAFDDTECDSLCLLGRTLDCLCLRAALTAAAAYRAAHEDIPTYEYDPATGAAIPSNVAALKARIAELERLCEQL
jgi:hypothetical protein